ncbi:MAG: 3-keto-5-aminohexanoate cleavage protein [Cyanobacteria bacterium NC_groundwater_1444_Ag_S-0.65um_54_12]|nr:3-keto-5-aminohexanoate cleavage protein [Cyanobacteria bacterium NC_groundwater_1444_Ag_S-0.65um_54_12]
MDKLIITCAPVGAETMKSDNPHQPYGPEEIALAAIAAVRSGASIIHLHVREDDGTPSQSPTLFAETIRHIKAEVDCIVQISTGGAVSATEEERLLPIRELIPSPEMASLTMGTCNFGDGVFWNPLGLIKRFLAEFQRHGIKPELEIFELGHLDNALRLLKEGALAGPQHCDFVLGVPGAMAATPANLLQLVSRMPAGSTWTVAGIGKAELLLGTIAIAIGGHVRVGFEDNVFYRKGELALSNAQLVERMKRIAAELNRPVATPAEARAILKLLKSQGSY